MEMCKIRKFYGISTLGIGVDELREENTTGIRGPSLQTTKNLIHSHFWVNRGDLQYTGIRGTEFREGIVRATESRAI